MREIVNHYWSCSDRNDAYLELIEHSDDDVFLLDDDFFAKQNAAFDGLDFVQFALDQNLDPQTLV